MKLTRIKRPLTNIFRNWFPVFLGIFVVLGLLFLSSFLVVKKVSCRTQYGPCQRALADRFTSLLGHNLLLVGRGSAWELVKDRGEIRDLEVKRNLPDTVTLDISVRKARVAVPVGERLYLIDLEGGIVGEETKSSLPTLVVENFSEIPGEDLTWAVKTLVNLQNVGFEPWGELREGDLVLRLNSRGPEVLVPRDKDPTALAGSLQFMTTRFTMEGKQPVSIDLRFKNPVITF